VTPVPPAPIATSAPVESAPAIPPAFPSSPGPARGSVGAAPPRAIATAEPGPRRTAKAKAAPAAPADPASAAEARSLASAFQKLRGAHDAVAALVALDDYQRAYPAGWLRGEAALARAEALLALGRESEALAALDAATFSGAVLTRDVRLARGQLLTRVGRCPDAVADFDGVLRVGDADAAGEQALAGRAGCQLRAGQSARAYEDLRRYLSLFPDGPYAAQARRWLRDAR
jgi:tetratricopeptide (TPR) repeat protein